ncbi:MAG TPA: hypothetical protein VIH17_04445 [Candidatus Acidoferrales bacterium]
MRGKGWIIAVFVLLVPVVAGYLHLRRSPPPAAPAAKAGPALGEAEWLRVASDESFDERWAEAPLWDDGLAEVATYAARRVQYGKPRSYDAVLILVKEEFTEKLYVKADPPYEGKPLLPVLKLNQIHAYPTENYPYHFLTSVFVRRDRAQQMVKLTVGSQEWCGNTFKEVRAWGPKAEIEFHSYFDGQGDGAQPLDLLAGDLLEDQLPVSLRALSFREGLKIRTRLLPSLITNRASPLGFQDAEIEVAGTEAVATPAGKIMSWKVIVRVPDGQSVYWIERAPPNALVKFVAWDGRGWLLKSRERRAYWQRPG